MNRSRWQYPTKTNYLYWCQTYGSKGSVASLGVASTVGVRNTDNVTSEVGTEPCIKDDVKKAYFKYSPNKQRTNVHSSLIIAKGDYTEQLCVDWLEAPEDMGQVFSLSMNPNIFDQLPVCGNVSTMSVCGISRTCLLKLFQHLLAVPSS